jgi:hypothetical protein
MTRALSASFFPLCVLLLPLLAVTSAPSAGAQEALDVPGPVIQFAFPPDVAAPPARRTQGSGAQGTARARNAVWSNPWMPMCSLRHPVCIHASAESSGALVLAALDAADRAWDTLTGALELLPPDADLDGVWHVFLVDEVDGDGVALPLARDPRAHFDRVASFGLVRRATPVGCALDLALARAIARGSLWRVAPATDTASAIAETEALARLASACSAGTSDQREFQSEPERPIVDPTVPAFDRGAALFFDWLDATRGSEPGALIRGLWALAPTRTPASAVRWAGAPTGFDVLGASLAAANQDAARPAPAPAAALDDAIVRFAAARAFFPAPTPTLAWLLPWPSAARRLACAKPPGPTGASYILVDHGTAPRTKLRVEATWEDFGRMRWVVVKIDAQGKPFAEIAIPSLDHATQGSMTIEWSEGTDRILIIAVNIGSTEHGFDPNQGEWEPHAWLLTLEAE